MASDGFGFSPFLMILLITKNFLASLPTFSMGVGGVRGAADSDALVSPLFPESRGADP
jgi:hypothetical protein